MAGLVDIEEEIVDIWVITDVFFRCTEVLSPGFDEGADQDLVTFSFLELVLFGFDVVGHFVARCFSKSQPTALFEVVLGLFDGGDLVPDWFPHVVSKFGNVCGSSGGDQHGIFPVKHAAAEDIVTSDTPTLYPIVFW